MFAAIRRSSSRVRSLAAVASSKRTGAVYSDLFASLQRSIRLCRRCWTVKASHHEETGDNRCATLNGVVGCSASRDVERPTTVRHRRPVSTVRPTTVGGSGPPVSTVAGPDDGRFLHRGNDRDVLQCTQRPEHEWLWIERRVRSEQRGPQQDVVHPPLRERNAGE